jgi:hypothetical protein
MYLQRSQWRRGAVAAWRSGGVAQWRSGAVAQWRSGAVALHTMSQEQTNRVLIPPGRKEVGRS